MLTAEEKLFIHEAVRHLDFPSFLSRVTNLVGKPIEKGIDLLPGKARDLVEVTSRKAIEGAFKAALSTLRKDRAPRGFREALEATDRAGLLHTTGTAITGAVSGFFGLPALLAELPLTTAIMLRSMADTASEFGEDMERRETQLECLYLFSLGTPNRADDEMESAYYTARIALSGMIERAMHFVAGKTAYEILRAVERKSAPALVDFIVKVAARFEVVVSEKAMGQLIPGIGAGAGALINAAFTEHFNALARYHFGLKRLEREHGTAAVKAEYRSAKAALMRGIRRS